MNLLPCPESPTIYRNMNQRGFTLGEFITVMVIILLLCFAAIPQFFALRNANHEKKRGILKSSTITLPATDPQEMYSSTGHR